MTKEQDTLKNKDEKKFGLFVDLTKKSFIEGYNLNGGLNVDLTTKKSFIEGYKLI